MNADLIANVAVIVPEIIVAFSAFGLLLLGVFVGNKSLQLVTYISIGALILAAIATLVEPAPSPLTTTLGKMLINNEYIRFAQLSVVVLTATAIFSTIRHLKQDTINSFEFPILMLFSCVGMLLLLSTNDLIIMFIALELQSLPIYVLVAMRRTDPQTSEAAVKYFILGALASIFIIYGSSFFYGYAGTTDFRGISMALQQFSTLPTQLILAMLLLAAGLAFKISAVPFHMWTPDIYEGTPTPVVLFIASAPKVAVMFFLMRLLLGPLGQFIDNWQPIIQILAILSMVLGSFTALFQINIKRLLAYSAISHMGYALVGLASASITGVQSVLVYLILYSIMAIGTFASLLNLRHHGKMLENIDDLRGLSKTYPKMAAVLAILVFSLGGIPPLAGFFAKVFVFMAAVDAGLYFLVIVGVLTSVVSMGYYLRIVKLMYFDEPAGKGATLPYDPTPSHQTALVVGAAAMINLLFFAWPQPLISKTEQMATTLFENE